MKKLFPLLLSLVLLAIVNCGGERSSNESASSEPPAAQILPRPKIVAFGDSLSAGLGLTAQETYPAQLQKILDEAGYKYEVVNAGVSGDTTSGGLRRMDWVLDDQVKIVVLELGANDILRGIPVQLMKDNLGKMIGSMKQRGIKVVLAGIEAPTNSGPEYRKEVHEVYKQLADENNVTFIPFILEGVVASEELNQEDLSHPNAKGAKVLANTVFNTIRPLL
jgi:acyl-CoA thioesterase-1